MGKIWLTNMVVEEWKELSKNVVSAKTVNIFKKRLNTYG